MLLVIFGAGASHDSNPAQPESGHQWRMPLADELFDDQFAPVLQRFERSLSIVPLLRYRMGNRGVEQVLEELQGEAGAGDRERASQLASVRFYLQGLIHECDRHWWEDHHGVSNYRTLLEEIRAGSPAGEDVLLVTFNYDELLERALPGIRQRIQTLEDYVNGGRFKVIKLHGSVHWARELDDGIEIGPRNPWQVVDEIVERAADLHPSNRYRFEPDASYPLCSVEGRPALPALAIPLQRKVDFECPDEHRAELARLLPQVTKVLLIGWRAMDEPFVDALATQIRRHVVGICVTKNADSAGEIVRLLAASGVRGSIQPMGGGFTELIKSRGVRTLLSTPEA